jgi:hypothetical protein
MATTSKTVSASASGAVVPNALVYELIASFNDLCDKYEATLAKLDADAGVTDVNYESTNGGSRKIVLRETGEPNA